MSVTKAGIETKDQFTQSSLRTIRRIFTGIDTRRNLYSPLISRCVCVYYKVIIDEASYTASCFGH
jgi:hypothetical protein